MKKDCNKIGVGADLFGTYRSGADLNGADLRGANLRKVDIRKADLWISHFRTFLVTATTKELRIGCESHSWDVWMDNEKRAKIALENKDGGDFEGFFKICLAAKEWLEAAHLRGSSIPRRSNC